MRKKLETSKVLEQKGRSLVELLGVLAVAGVLSVAGLYGFGYAMEKWRENETLDRYAKVVAGVRTSRILEDENEGYRTKYFVDGINHVLRDAFVRQHVDMKQVISNVGDDSDDAADSDDFVTYRKGITHVLGFFFLFFLRTDCKEIENRKHDHDHNDSAPGSGCAHSRSGTVEKCKHFYLRNCYLRRLYTKKPNSSIPNREILSQMVKKA